MPLSQVLPIGEKEENYESRESSRDRFALIRAIRSFLCPPRQAVSN